MLLTDLRLTSLWPTSSTLLEFATMLSNNWIGHLSVENLAQLPLATYGAWRIFGLRHNIPIFFVVTGDFVYFLGQLTNESVTSTVGAFFVIVSTLVSLYLRFKKESSELRRDQESKDREAKRVQDEKDLHLRGQIEEARKLLVKIRQLEEKLEELEDTNESLAAENKDLKRLTRN